MHPNCTRTCEACGQSFTVAYPSIPKRFCSRTCRFASLRKPITAEKQCSRCRETLPLTEFHHDKSRPDGRQRTCKACQVAQDLEWREHNPERARAAWRRERAANNRNGNAYNTPEANRAYTAVQDALKAGRLTRPQACQCCGKSDSPIHAHHEDYSKPLDVLWLCARCHARLHAAHPSTIKAIRKVMAQAKEQPQ